jgi:hypothetical protein
MGKCIPTIWICGNGSGSGYKCPGVTYPSHCTAVINTALSTPQHNFTGGGAAAAASSSSSSQLSLGTTGASGGIPLDHESGSAAASHGGDLALQRVPGGVKAPTHQRVSQQQFEHSLDTPSSAVFNYNGTCNPESVQQLATLVNIRGTMQPGWGLMYLLMSKNYT